MRATCAKPDDADFVESRFVPQKRAEVTFLPLIRPGGLSGRLLFFAVLTKILRPCGNRSSWFQVELLFLFCSYITYQQFHMTLSGGSRTHSAFKVSKNACCEFFVSFICDLLVQVWGNPTFGIDQADKI